MAHKSRQERTKSIMKPQHISELIDQLIATGKLPPSEKPARKARKPVRKIRRARQMKLNFKA